MGDHDATPGRGDVTGRRARTDIHLTHREVSAQGADLGRLCAADRGVAYLVAVPPRRATRASGAFGVVRRQGRRRHVARAWCRERVVPLTTGAAAAEPPGAGNQRRQTVDRCDFGWCGWSQIRITRTELSGRRARGRHAGEAHNRRARVARGTEAEPPEDAGIPPSQHDRQIMLVRDRACERGSPASGCPGSRRSGGSGR
jgi:hypothetical protein